MKAKPTPDVQTLTINSRVLRTAVAGIIKALPAKAFIPCLENIRLDARNGQLTLTAFDMSNAAQRTIPVEGEALLLIPGKLLSDLLATLPDAPLRIEHDPATFGIRLFIGNSHYKLSGENPIDFPRLPDTDRPLFETTLAGFELIDGLNHTRPFTSTDELRPNMCGIFLHHQAGQSGQPGTLKMVATNGHYLTAFTTATTAEQDFSFILAHQGAGLLCEYLNPEATVTITVLKTAVRFDTDDVTIYARLIDEHYPEYENAIPTDNPIRLTVDAAELRSVVRRANICAN